MKKTLLLLSCVLPLLSCCQDSIPINKILQGRMGCGIIASDTTTHFRTHCSRTIKSDNEPLIVLDGELTTSRKFSSIDPNSIESISILKDASVTAIYGYRAMNGVILITSKKEILIKDLETGQAVPNASVKIILRDETLEVAADSNGIVALPMDKFQSIKTVAVSCVGYEPKIQSSVNTNKLIVISLTKKVSKLGEVVVVNYSATSCRLVCCCGVICTVKNSPDSKLNFTQKENAMTIYPNPVKSNGRLRIISKQPYNNYQIFSTAGVLMQEGMITISAGQPLSVSINHFAAGNYIIRFANKTTLTSVSQQFIVQ